MVASVDEVVVSVDEVIVSVDEVVVSDSTAVGVLAASNDAVAPAEAYL